MCYKSFNPVFFVVGFWIFFTACSDPRAPSTVKMADMLQAIANAAEPSYYPYLNTEYANQQAVMLQGVPYKIPINRRLTYARQLIYAGKIEEGIQELEKTIEARFDSEQIDRTGKPYFDLLALGYLRLGEQQNCILNHTAESCLIPIKGDGIHTLTYGSENAIETYTKIIQQYPEDLQSRWLMNIAYMTLGRYPENVPEEYLIPDSLFRSDMEFPTFHDRAIGLRVDTEALAGGSITEDFNNDGFLDLFATSWGLSDQIRLFLGNGEGFVDFTEEAGLMGITSGLNTLQADYDNDGLVDILILRGAWLYSAGGHPNSLLKNLGGGKFRDVTEEAGLLTFHPTQTATWADFNRDGSVDLFIGNESGQRYHYCELFINQGDGTFVDKAEEWEANINEFVKGVTSGDINNDGLADLYLSVLGKPNVLLLNNGNKFVDITESAGVGDPVFSFPCWFWDYNNDGFEDIFISGFKLAGSYSGYSFGVFSNVSKDVAADMLGLPHDSEFPRLYRNNGNLTFTDVTDSLDLRTVLFTMGCNYGDLDNDGYTDFYVGTGAPDFTSTVPNKMYRNNEGKAFQDVTTAGGFGQIQKGHGVSFADLDNDGDQDIFTVIGGAVEGDVYGNMLMENPGFDNNWITLKLQGSKANRSAIGAKIKVYCKKGDEATVFHKTTGSGGSFGANSLQTEIGLGKADKIDSLVIHWPDQDYSRQVIYDIRVNGFYLITQGNKPVPDPRKVFTLAETSDHDDAGHTH